MSDIKNANLQKKREFLLNNDNLYLNALYLAWPIVLQSLLQVSISTIDIKMVGTLGIDAISAVGAGRNIVMLIMVIVIAISTGTTAMVSRYIGRGDEESASISGGESFRLCIIASAFMIPIGLITNKWILGFLGLTENAFALAEGYMIVFFITLPFFLLNFIARAIFQGSGDTVTPLIIDIIMNVSNIIFNFFFIFGLWIFPELGVVGAAVATALSRLIGSLLGWSALISGKFSIKISLKHIIRRKKKKAGSIMKIGLPAALQGLTRNISTFALFAILGATAMSESAIPAFVIGTNLSQYALMPGLAVGTAAATLSGMNIGANKLKRAEDSAKACTILGMGIMVFFALIFVFFAEPLINFFLDEKNPDVLYLGKSFLYIIAISEPFHATTIILSRSMQGAGYTKVPFYITVITWIFLRLSVAYILAIVLNLGPIGVWIGMTSSTIASGIIAFIVFKQNKWKEVKLD